MSATAGRKLEKARLAVRTADKEDQIARLICPTGKSPKSLSSPFRENNPLRDSPKSAVKLRPSRATQRGVSRSSRTLVRDAVDAAASGARGVAGRISVSDHPARRRPALKRLRQNFDRQHMSRSRRFGGGSCGRQRRVVLAPVAGVKLTEIQRTQPGLSESPIRQRRWQEEFVAGESAL